MKLLKIEAIADFHLPIADLKTSVLFAFPQLNYETPVALNWQSAIGNWQCPYAAT